MAARRSRKAQQGETPGSLAALETRLGYAFRNRELLRLALTHRSFSYESRGVDERHAPAGSAIPGEDNEQLEFLGDAVLGLVVAESLCRQFPERSEGELTRLRASLVGRKRMGEVGQALGLGEALLLGRTAEQAGSREKPAVLGNAAEAVLAAVYLDGGLEVARALIERAVIQPEMSSLREALTGARGGTLRDYKTLLQEQVQASRAGRLRYIDTEDKGPSQPLRFTVEAQLESEEGTRVLAPGSGGTKKEAQQNAAERALKTWLAAKAQFVVRDAAIEAPV